MQSHNLKKLQQKSQAASQLPLAGSTEYLVDDSVHSLLKAHVG